MNLKYDNPEHLQTFMPSQNIAIKYNKHVRYQLMNINNTDLNAMLHQMETWNTWQKF